jgi:hypothetical protein
MAEVRLGTPYGGATAQSFSAKNRFFEIVLNRPFLSEKTEQWRFAKKRRLALCVIYR